MAGWSELSRFLRESDTDVVRLSYAELETVLGRPLPASAVRHRPQFWSNAERNAYADHWRRAGYATRLRGADPREVVFVRTRAGEHREASRAGSSAARSTAAEIDVVLVGCVATKASSARPARELYQSPLFARRAEYAESSGLPWVILSAEHGVVDPDEVIEPYDRSIEQSAAAYRRRWGQEVVDELAARFGSLNGLVFELHAGAAYGDPIERLLDDRGARLERPLTGLRIGEQLAWYGGDEDVGAAAAHSVSRGDAAVDDSPPAPSDDEPVVARLTEAFVSGTLDLSGRPEAPAPGWRSMPEVVALDRLRAFGADSVAVRRFCTFVMAMDRARDADRLWESATALYEQQAWLFDPSWVASSALTPVADALRRSGVSQRHTADAAAWKVIGESLATAGAAPAIQRVIHEGQGDTQQLLADVRAETANGTPRFPLLRGPKIATVWVRILAEPGGATISGLDALPVAVDVQVRKVSEYLGVTDTAGMSLDEARPVIQEAWQHQVEQAGAAGPASVANTSSAVDPAVWFYGKWGCTRCEQAGALRPISPLCRRCRFVPRRT